MSGAADTGAGAGRAARWDAAAAVLAVLGLLDAAYLTVEHLAGRSVRCMVVTGCDAVLASRYATVADKIPLAAVGALAYFAVFSLAVLAAFGYGGVRGALKITVALMFAFTLWLLY